jgi:ketosteroid isomerase-like protein
MKTILLSVFLSVTSLITSTTVTLAQHSGEEAAIQQVLTTSFDAFGQRDLNSFAAYFVKSPKLFYQVYTIEGQLIVAHGWEAMTHMVGTHMKNDPNDFKGKNSLSDFRIHVQGTMAWVHQTSRWELPGGVYKGSDIVVLQKQAGKWKIAALSTQTYAEGKLVVVK